MSLSGCPGIPRVNDDSPLRSPLWLDKHSALYCIRVSADILSPRLHVGWRHKPRFEALREAVEIAGGHRLFSCIVAILRLLIEWS